MQMISSNTNVLKAFQNLSDNDNFVLSKDGSNLHKTSTWQDIKNYFGTSGAKALNQRTIEGLRNLFVRDPLYAGAKDIVNAELNTLAASGGAVSGKFVRSLFTKLNLEANISNVKKTVSNRLAILLVPAQEGAEKTVLQQKLDAVRKLQEDCHFVEDLDVSLKKCIENQLVDELLGATDENGVLKSDHQMSTVEDKLIKLLNEISEANQTGLALISGDRAASRQMKLTLDLRLRGITDDALEESRKAILQQGEAGRPQNAQTRAKMQFALPESIAQHRALRTFSVSKEALQRVYTLERQMMTTLTDEAIITELNNAQNGLKIARSPLLRLALNPQFLTDKTAYLKGKALLADETKAVKSPVGWGVYEAARKKSGFYKSIMADSKLREENEKFAKDTFGLDPNSAVFKKVVDQMTRMSAHHAFSAFDSACDKMSDAYIGKRPKDGKHPNIHLADPIMPPASDFAAVKTMRPKVLDKLSKMFKDKAGDDKFASAVPVFMARVFNAETISRLNEYEATCKDKKGVFDPEKFDQKLTEKISSYMQEALDVMEVFGEDTEAVDAYCHQMNYTSTNGDMQGSALSRKAIEALRDQIASVKTWVGDILKKGRPIGANDILLLYQTAKNRLLNPGFQKYGTGIDEMAFGMVKTMGGFKIGNKTELKSLVKTGTVDTIIRDLLKNYGEMLTRKGLVDTQKKLTTIGAYTFDAKDEKAYELKKEDVPQYVQCADIAHETAMQFDLLGMIVNVVHFSMGSDEGVDYDTEAFCNSVQQSGVTSNTEDIPMPGFENDENPTTFDKSVLVNILKVGRGIRDHFGKQQ